MEKKEIKLNDDQVKAKDWVESIEMLEHSLSVLKSEILGAKDNDSIPPFKLACALPSDGLVHFLRMSHCNSMYEAKFVQRLLEDCSDAGRAMALSILLESVTDDMELLQAQDEAPPKEELN